MSKKAGESASHPYTGAAGGWDALATSARHLMASGSPLRGARSLMRVNQPDGFDCPGCAWGDPRHASSFEFCENGVKAVAWESTRKACGPDFFADHSVTWLRSQDGHFLEDQGRLTHPMVYDPATDRYRPIAWDAAFALIGRELRALDHPDRALFYTSGRTSNEAAFLYQLFARAYGTNNLPDCSNMCHEASGVALKEVIGTAKGTVRLDDFEQADAIFIFGQNPGTNHPRMLGDLRRAAERGAAIVTFNPIKERGLERFANPKSPRDMLTGGAGTISSHYLHPRIGGDMAAVKGMMKWLLAADRDGHPGAIDHAFIAAHTSGYDRLVADLDATGWDDIERRSGLDRQALKAAADIYSAADRTIFTWAMGITQHKHAVITIQTFVDMLLMGGNIGRPGAGACPVRGHSNVQGDRTMGVTEHPEPAFLDRLDDAFAIAAPRVAGLNTVEAIAAMRDGRASVFIAMGGNFAAATPDTAVTEAALSRCRLTVHVSTKLNRSHLVHGDQALILPALGRTDVDLQAAGPQQVTVEDSMSMVHASAGLNAPLSDQMRSEPAIVAGMAMATLPDGGIDWQALVDDYGLIRDRIGDVVPGFEDFNARIAEPGGFYLGNPARERRWAVDGGKARFTAAALPDRQAAATAGTRVFTLMTLRSHDQYNTTVYGLNDRYRGVSGDRRVCFANARDLAEAGLSPGDRVDIETVDPATAGGDGMRRVARGFRLIAYDIPRGCLASYFPETNVLVPLDSYGDKSFTPTSKSIPVTLSRSPDP